MEGRTPSSAQTAPQTYQCAEPRCRYSSGGAEKNSVILRSEGSHATWRHHSPCRELLPLPSAPEILRQNQQSTIVPPLPQPHLHPQVPRHKRPLVPHLVNLLRNRLSASVARFRLYPNQHRSRARLVRLHRSCEFEAVPRHHAVVMVSSHNEGRRVFCPRLQIVQWRIRIQRLELLRIVRRPVIRSPRPPNRELVKAQHVHHAHSGQSRAEKVRTLRLASSNQQPAVAASRNRQLRR